MSKWTTAQQEVIDTRNASLLVSAAAGSGKTAVLVQRIIDLVKGVGSEPVDMLHRGRAVVHDRRAQAQVSVLMVISVLSQRLTGNHAADILSAEETHPAGIHMCLQCRQEPFGRIPVDQHRFYAVAGHRILGLSICDHLKSQVKIRLRIHIQVADTVRMAHHRNAGMIHDIAYKGI
jgi:hypothetical protein